MTCSIPSDFFQLVLDDGPTRAFGPLYGRRDGDRHMTVGVLVDDRHCNPRGDLHGGVWAYLADVQLGLNTGLFTGRAGPTVTLNVDYLRPALKGQWIEGTTRVLRETSTLGFADATFTADGELALRANATLRLRHSFGGKHVEARDLSDAS